MSNLFKTFQFISLALLLTLGIMAFSQSPVVLADSDKVKVNVCQQQPGGNWVANNVDEDKVDSNDFAYSGPVDDKGKPEQNGGDKTADNWCNDHAPTLEPSDNPGNQPESRAYCHATSSEVNPYNYLKNPAWVQHFENNGTPQAGHELDFFTWEGDNDCAGYTKVCTDSTATNYVSALAINQIGGGDCTYPSNPPGGNSGGSSSSSNNSSSNNNSGSVQGDSTPEIGGEVLGAYAATGIVQDVIMNVLGSVGGLMTMAGSVLYGKKSKKLAL